MIVGRTINYRMLRNPVAAHRARRSIWTPAALFAQGQQGVWYEPKPQYLYQDAAGTVPVTADGDPVGLMLDRSPNGNHATQSTSAARPIYRTDGVLHWLEFDGVGDYMSLNQAVGGSGASSHTVVSGVRNTATGVGNINNRYMFGGNSDTGIVQLLNQGEQTRTGKINVIVNGTTSTRQRDFVYTTRFDNQSGMLEVGTDGVVENSQSFAPPSNITQATDYSLGARGENNPFWLGNFYGAVHISVALPDNQLSQTEQYIANLAGVTL